MVRRSYHHGELRTALLDTAEALTRERGVDGWSLREVTGRIGVSPSAAYHHFSSRDALLRALSRRVLAQLGERLSDAARRAVGDDADGRYGADGQDAREGQAHRGGQADRGGENDRDGEDCKADGGYSDGGGGRDAQDAQAGLIAFGRGYVRFTVEDPALARLAFSLGGGDELPAAPHPHRTLTRELDRFVEEGGMPTAARPGAEFVVWSAVHGLAVLLADGLMRLDEPRFVDHEAERVVRAVLTGLAEQSPSPASRPVPRSSYTERLAGPRTT